MSNEFKNDKYFNSHLFEVFMKKLSELEEEVTFSSWKPSEAFWFTRLNFEHFLKRVKYYDPTQNSDELKLKINIIKNNIVRHYSKKFDDDFENFTLNMVAAIYRDINKFDITSIESLHLSDDLKEKPPKSIELLENLTNVIKNVKNLKSDINNFNKELKYKELPIDEIVIENINYVKNLINYRTFDGFNELKEPIKNISKSIISLQNSIKDLALNYEDDDFQKIRELIKPYSNQKELENILASIEYAIDGSFNQELILIFTFSNLNYPPDSKMKYIIKKHEQFFINIYEGLRKLDTLDTENINMLIHIPHCPEEITNPYYYTDKKFEVEFKPDILQLKQLLALFKFYIGLSKEDLSLSIANTVRDYIQIMKETKITDVFYDPILDNLPLYLMNILGLTKKDLSFILGIDSSTLSRQLKNPKKLISDHLWFWKVATGFTSTYLNGNTTIPDYGKHFSKDDTKYEFCPIRFIGYAEFFLRNISQLKEYQESLKTGKIPAKKIYILSKEYLRKISCAAMELSERIGEHRIALDNLYEGYLLSLNKCGENSEESKKIHDFFINYFNNIIKLLNISFYPREYEPKFLTSKINDAVQKLNSGEPANDKQYYDEAINNFSNYLKRQSDYLEKLNAIINETKPKNR